MGEDMSDKSKQRWASHDKRMLSIGKECAYAETKAYFGSFASDVINKTVLMDWLEGKRLAAIDGK